MPVKKAKKAEKVPTAAELLDSIKKRLDGLEDNMCWMVRAEQRFENGQRVQFSAMADRRTISQRRKGGVRTGTVEGFSHAFGLLVRLDGYAKAKSFHHGFFDPIPTKRARR